MDYGSKRVKGKNCWGTIVCGASIAQIVAWGPRRSLDAVASIIDAGLHVVPRPLGALAVVYRNGRGVPHGTWLPGAWNIALAAIRAIGVGEIEYAKGHKYPTLSYQIDTDRRNSPTGLNSSARMCGSLI